jgi:hypothetical protein
MKGLVAVLVYITGVEGPFRSRRQAAQSRHSGLLPRCHMLAIPTGHALSILPTGSRTQTRKTRRAARLGLGVRILWERGSVSMALVYLPLRCLRYHGGYFVLRDTSMRGDLV